jgi:hypothetical protein
MQDKAAARHQTATTTIGTADDADERGFPGEITDFDPRVSAESAVPLFPNA